MKSLRSRIPLGSCGIRALLCIGLLFELSGATSAQISTNKAQYVTGESIVVSFSIGTTQSATATDWVSVTGRGTLPPSILWQYACGGMTVCSSAISNGAVTFSADELSAGDYDVTYFANDGYSALAGPAHFSVDHPGGNPTCVSATSTPYPVVHVLPSEYSALSTVAFSSCYKPANQNSDTLWKHMREVLSPDLWLWLGDNMYADGVNLEYKRSAYSDARSDPYYSAYGPLASPMIPVMATWDDHDASSNNDGSGYDCTLESETEFVIHFGIPPSDPRHPDQGSDRQVGVYSATMFSRPEEVGGGNGIHVIMLDGRTGRDPTFPDYGACRGGETQMLSASQWSWLDSELQKYSDVKIIGSGTQVLPPTDLLGRAGADYCAYDGVGGSFDLAISNLGESISTRGTGVFLILIFGLK